LRGFHYVLKYPQVMSNIALNDVKMMSNKVTLFLELWKS